MQRYFRYVFLTSIILLCFLTAIYINQSSANTFTQQDKEKPQIQENSSNDLPIIRTRTDLVTMTVTVTDELGRYVAGLEKEHFQVYDDNVLQNIEFFSTGEGPISVGIILDVSASMNGQGLISAVDTLHKFLNIFHEDDEYFLITFNNEPQLMVDFRPIKGQSTDTIILKADKNTAVYDAVYLGLEKLRQARHKRRALLILSDGQDNNSRYTYNDVKKLARESDVQIYAIGGGNYGSMVLGELAHLTGGSFYTTISMDAAIDWIQLELRHQYNIGFIPTANTGERRWHRLKVKVKPPKGLLKLSVRTKEGYFSNGLDTP
ncbi:MAG: VWA domain-containing protein [Acidobacteriota bacterium]